ncbi:hypothetical protein ABE85_07760 [Mitsuaria sp. 7]|nr:hypothetical protein ABE85_07760 [Mitsuaria sp. 7]
MVIYDSMWLMRRIGPLLQGVLLEKTQDGSCYCPTLHIHTFSRPLGYVALNVAQPLLTVRTRASEYIKVLHHDKHFSEGAKRLAASSLLPIEGDISLDEVMAAYRSFETFPASDAPFSINYFESAISLHAWCGQINRGKQALEEYLEVITQWPDRVIERLGSVDKWRSDMLAVLANPDAIRETAEQQATVLKATTLPFSEFRR